MRWSLFIVGGWLTLTALLPLQALAAPASPATTPTPVPAASPLPAVPPTVSDPFSSPSEANPSPQDSVPLTLVQALGEAVERHPQVLGARSVAEAARAAAKGAYALANPKFQFGVGTIENNNNNNQVNQDIEMFGQQGLRGGAASADAYGAESNLLSVRRQVVRSAATAYYLYWVMTQRYDIARHYLQAIWRLKEVATQRSQGKDTHDLLRAQVELVRAQVELTQAHADKHVAQARLNAAMGREDDPLIVIPDDSNDVDLDAPSDPYRRQLPPLPELVRLSEDRPEVRQSRWLVEAAYKRGQLGNRNWLPYLGIQGNLSKWNYATASRGFQFSLYLPLWDWGRLKAERASAWKLHQASLHNLQNTRIGVHLDVRTTWLAFQSAVLRREELRKRCPSFVQAAEQAETQYTNRELSIDDTLNTLKSSRDALVEYLAAEGSFHTARIDVLWASGISMVPPGTEPLKVPRPPGTSPPSPSPSPSRGKTP